MASGSAIGGLIGTAGGAAIGGPIGASIGGGLGTAVGGMVDNANQNIPEVAASDPNQIARLKEIQNTKKEIESGTDTLVQQRISDINRSGETTKAQLGKFTGGDVGGTLSAMLRAQRNIGRAQNQAFTESQKRLPFFENLESQLGNRISQRKLELDVNAQDTARAERANTNRQIAAGISGAIGSGVGAISGSGLIGSGTGAIPAATGGGGVDSMGQFQAPVGGINPTLPPASSLTPINVTSAAQQGIGGGTLGSGFGGFG